LHQTVARKKATCPSAIDDRPKSEGPIFVSMTASEPFIDGQFRTVSSVEPVTDAVTEQVLGEGPDASQLCSRETGAPMSYGPAPHTAHNLARGCFIGSPHAGAEAEIRVIGGVDGIGVRLVRNHRRNRSARDTETLDYSEGVLRTGFQQSASFLRILSGLRT
jgi:hypothetical protein